MSLTKATYSMVNGAPFNILDYGASESATGAVNTAAIQAAVDAAYAAGGGVVYIPYGQYPVATVTTNPASGSAAVAVVLKDNINVNFADGAELVLANTGNTQSYAVFLVADAEYVSVTGKGFITGDWTTHTGSLGEGGMCLWLAGAQWFKSSGMTYRQGWGDGILISRSYASGGNTASEYVFLENVICESNRRQGISLISGNHVVMNDCELRGTGYKPGGGFGTAPMAGIDIEPDDVADWVRDITINNLITSSNVGAGIRIDLNAVALTDNLYQMTVNNHKDFDSGYGFVYSGQPGATRGYLVVNNPVWVNNQANAFAMEDNAGTGLQVFLNRPTAINPGRTALSQNTGAFQFTASASMTASMGNVVVVNPSVKYDSTIGSTDRCYYAFQFQADAATGFDSTFKLIDPLTAQGDPAAAGSNANALYYESGIGTQGQFVSNLYSVFEDKGIYVNTKVVTTASAAPTTGTWAQGDVVFKSNATSGQPAGWMCTVAGTPGTWKAMANLA
jgi:hypothetical protein